MENNFLSNDQFENLLNKILKDERNFLETINPKINKSKNTQKNNKKLSKMTIRQND